MTDTTDGGGFVSTVGDADTTLVGAGIGLVVGYLLLSLVAGEAVAGAANAVNRFLWQELPWLFLAPTLLFVLIAFGLLAGPWGSHRLGEGPPEFGFGTYFAMLFSSGIAAGIVFWGPAEAMYHYATVPPFLEAEPGTSAAAVGAVEYTLFHWGLTPWATYAVVAVPIGYFAYRYDAPLRVSTVLLPFVGRDGLESAPARGVDVLALFATLGGLGTSVGLVSEQFLTGVQYGFDASVGPLGLVLVVLVFALVFTVATVTGLHRGIRRIALLNTAVFAVVAVALLVVGPTGDVVTTGGAAVAGYLVDFLPMSLYAGDRGWLGSWTVFYWAWWLSWAPFVALFVARISKGRTVRQVTATTLLGASAATMAWYVVFGGVATSLQRSGRADILGVVREYGTAASGFPLFGALPLGDVLLVLFLGGIVTFLVTSANASTLSLSMLAEDGTGDPSTEIRAFWGLLQGVAASVLIVLGSAGTLQTASLVTGAPFALVGLVAAAGFAREVATDGSAVEQGTANPTPGPAGGAASDGPTAAGSSAVAAPGAGATPASDEPEPTPESGPSDAEATAERD
jgi:glycine betaine transporter